MKTTERHLGIIVEHSHLTAVEIAHSPKGYTLTAAGSFVSQLDFDDQALFEQPGATQRERLFTRELSVFLKKIGSGSRLFSFGLNSKMVMLQTVPVEKSLNGSEVDQQAKWELNQFYLDSHPHAFTVSTQPLIAEEDAPSVPTLILAVRKSFINFLSRICAQAGATLHIVDIDHFCAENALLFNYPDASSSRVLLVGADETSFDVSTLAGGKTVDVSIIPRGSELDIAELVAYAGRMKPEKVFFHGRIMAPSFVESAGAALAVPTEVINPFQKVTLPRSLNNYAEVERTKHSFAAAVGLALRSE
jgi:Tfp pilus assembly PilM family ATPase